jgi:hypothetical protein
MAKIRSFRDKAKSPYAKYQKAPFRYSDTERAIMELIHKGGSNQTDRVMALRQEHAAKFGYSLRFLTLTADEGEAA